MHQKKNTVLIVEDDFTIRKALTISLESADYKVVECMNGREGIRLAAAVNPELIMVDLTLPDINGKEVIAAVREWSQVPIIVCSAHNEDQEIVAALDAGANDYIVKPFNPQVVLARIHANLRKAVTMQAGEPELVNGNIRMDLVRHKVYINDEHTLFTPKEYELLRHLLIHRGRMLTHHEILKNVWGTAHIDDMQYLRVYVRQLREKLASVGCPECIMTEPGVGYRMELITPQARELARA